MQNEFLAYTGSWIDAASFMLLVVSHIIYSQKKGKLFKSVIYFTNHRNKNLSTYFWRPTLLEINNISISHNYVKLILLSPFCRQRKWNPERLNDSTRDILLLSEAACDSGPDSKALSISICPHLPVRRLWFRNSSVIFTNGRNSGWSINSA